MNINNIFSIYVPIFFTRVIVHVGPLDKDSIIQALGTAELINRTGERKPLSDEAKEFLKEFMSHLSEGNESCKGFVRNFHNKHGIFCHIDSGDKDNNSLTVPMIAAISHECVHIAEDILRERHIREDPRYASECIAYLQSHLVQEIIYVLNKHVHKDEPKKEGETNERSN